MLISFNRFTPTATAAIRLIEDGIGPIIAPRTMPVPSHFGSSRLTHSTDSSRLRALKPSLNAKNAYQRHGNPQPARLHPRMLALRMDK